MLFVVQFEDIYAERPERLLERAEHMADHLDPFTSPCLRASDWVG